MSSSECKQETTTATEQRDKVDWQKEKTRCKELELEKTRELVRLEKLRIKQAVLEISTPRRSTVLMTF
ncbi:hypothetical protein BGZ65_000470, partial [Modicella reniformis]